MYIKHSEQTAWISLRLLRQLQPLLESLPKRQFFFLFTAQTKGFHFARAVNVGKAGYVATGRGFVIEPSSFVKLFALYAKSHIYTGVEALGRSPIPTGGSMAGMTPLFGYTLTLFM